MGGRTARHAPPCHHGNRDDDLDGNPIGTHWADRPDRLAATADHRGSGTLAADIVWPSSVAGKSSMVQCRCAVLNHLSGGIAADYARTHLHSLGNGNHRVLTCPDTGVRWADDSVPGTGGGIDRLRRQER